MTKSKYERGPLCTLASGLVIALLLTGCGGGGGGSNRGPTTPPPPPAASTFSVSLDEVLVVDRNDGTSLAATGGAVSGATATLN